MDVSKYKLKIKTHAYLRAIERGIEPNSIESLLKNGKITRFGKHGVKFINEGKKRTIICVGELVNTELRIFTVEVQNEKMH